MTTLITHQIRRVFHNPSPYTLLTMYKLYVLPHFNYLAPVWYSPSTSVTQLCTLEKIQWRFIKRLSPAASEPFDCPHCAIHSLKIFSIQRRLDRSSLLLLNDMRTNRLKQPRTPLVTFTLHPRRGYQAKYNGNMNIYSTWRDHHPLYHAISMYNLLPSHITNPTSPNPPPFKTLLDTFLRTLPDYPQPLNRNCSSPFSSNSLFTILQQFPTLQSSQSLRFSTQCVNGV